ncbi:MAG TPA: serine hydrolase, partial [Cyclobacteriaceae bacterium]|nr:serine hydrolase [Cyclobacteriaceae bacterium]
MSNRLFPLALLLLLGCKQDQGTTDSRLKAYFDSHNIPAAFMGSIDERGNVTFHAFGPSVWGGKDTITVDHIFRIFSMTKAIASVAAMQL